MGVYLCGCLGTDESLLLNILRREQGRLDEVGREKDCARSSSIYLSLFRACSYHHPFLL